MQSQLYRTVRPASFLRRLTITRRLTIPRSLDEQRDALRSLFYKSSYPLTGPELKTLLKSRQVRITRQGINIIMHVHPEQWSVPEHLWENLATVLNDMHATSVIRDKLALQIDIANPDETVSVNLSAQNAFSVNDWVDHA
jgi:hypothetical protein